MTEITNPTPNGDDVERAIDGDGTRPTITKEPASKAPTTATELLRGDAGDVEAAVVAMERSGAERITAERATLDRSGAKTIEARSVQMERSGAVNLTSEHAVVHDGSAVIIKAKDARLVKSRVVVLVADTAHLESGSRALVQISGNIATTRAAMAGVAALVATITLVAGRILFGRRRG